MTLEHISMRQALNVWSELEQAYYGDNKYGSDTAEVYAYRLLPNMPVEHWEHQSPPMREYSREQYILARSALAALCAIFAEDRECRVLIDGQHPDFWDDGTPFDHRAHVQVIK